MRVINANNQTELRNMYCNKHTWPEQACMFTLEIISISTAEATKRWVFLHVFVRNKHAQGFGVRSGRLAQIWGEHPDRFGRRHGEDVNLNNWRSPVMFGTRTHRYTRSYIYICCVCVRVCAHRWWRWADPVRSLSITFSSSSRVDRNVPMPRSTRAAAAILKVKAIQCAHCSRRRLNNIYIIYDIHKRAPNAAGDLWVDYDKLCAHECASACPPLYARKRARVSMNYLRTARRPSSAIKATASSPDDGWWWLMVFWQNPAVVLRVAAASQQCRLWLIHWQFDL